MSRSELATLADVDYWTLGRIERGQQRPLPATLRRIGAALDLCLDDLAQAWSHDELERITSGAVHPGIGLRVLRQRAQISLSRAAAAAGVNTSTLSRFERGLHGSRTLFRLGDYDLGAESPNQVAITNAQLAKLLGFASSLELASACAAIKVDD